VNIWDEICSLAALERAWGKVRSNDGAAGGDGVSIDRFGRKVKGRLAELSHSLQRGEFIHGPYARFDIPKRNGGYRRLTVPPVADRVVHTSVAMTLSPVLEPFFEDSSFAYRPGRSVHQAVAAIERWRDEGYRQVIEADIRNYFDNVRHRSLIETLLRHIRHLDGHVALVEFISDALEHQGAELDSPGLGLVQGSPMSPLLANLYLDILDEELHGRGVRIVRFADDFVVLCKKARQVDAAAEELEDVLGSIGLELHPEKTRVVDFDKGFEFLGYLFVRSLAMQRSPQSGRKPHKSAPRPGTGPHRGGPTNLESPAMPAIAEHSSSQEEAMPEMGEDTASVRPDRKDHARGPRVMYVLEPGRRITVRNKTFVILQQDGRELLAVNCTKVDRLEVGRNVVMTNETINQCLSEDVELAFLDGFGTERGRLFNENDRRAALQFEQARACADTAFCTALARKAVDARIRNQRTQLFRLNRRQENAQVKDALDRMGRHLRKLESGAAVDILRGLEGASGAEYWLSLGRLCIAGHARFIRSRPAADPLNATINFMTAILQRDIRTAVKSAGLHTGFGFLHKPRDYSEAAVFDLMEPFRAPLTEGLAVFLFNSKRLKPEMFERRESNVVRISAVGRRAIITGYEQSVAKRVNVTGSKRKLAWRPMMRHQALTLARAYRDENPDLFQPYLMEA